MDKAGVQPGDIISSMEGISLGRGGTMGESCDVLKSHTPEDTLAIEIIRFSTGELLAGQLNGRELATASTFGTEPTRTGTGGTLRRRLDAYGSSRRDPVSWADTDGSEWLMAVTSSAHDLGSSRPAGLAS
jgi:serine protease Do